MLSTAKWAVRRASNCADVTDWISAVVSLAMATVDSAAIWALDSMEIVARERAPRLTRDNRGAIRPRPDLDALILIRLASEPDEWVNTPRKLSLNRVRHRKRAVNFRQLRRRQMRFRLFVHPLFANFAPIRRKSQPEPKSSLHRNPAPRYRRFPMSMPFLLPFPMPADEAGPRCAMQRQGGLSARPVAERASLGRAVAGLDRKALARPAEEGFDSRWHRAL